MAKQIEFHKAAAAALEAAFDWYLDKNEEVAARVLDEIDYALESIAAASDRWPVCQGNGRKFVLRRFPFVVIYRDAPSIVQIVAVAHTRRRPFYWKGRL